MTDIDFEDRGTVLLVRPQMQRLDALVATDFRDAVVRRAKKHAGVVVDLGIVRFIDSSGLAALVSILKQVAPGTLSLANVSASVAGLLQLTRLNKVFSVHPSVGEALGASGT